MADEYDWLFNPSEEEIAAASGPLRLDSIPVVIKDSETRRAEKAARTAITAAEKGLSVQELELSQIRLRNMEESLTRARRGYNRRNERLAQIYDDTLLNQLAGESRSAGQLARDTGVSLEGGAVNMTAGIPMGVLDLATQDNITGDLFSLNPVQGIQRAADRVVDAIRGKERPATASDRLREAMRSEVLAPMQRSLGEYNNERQERYSAPSRADAELFGRENQIAAERSKAQAEEEIKAGGNAFMANLKRVGRDALHDGGNLLDHGKVFGNLLTEQVPSLATGVVSKAGVTREAVEALTKRLSALPEEAQKRLTRNGLISLEDVAAARLASNNLTMTVAGTEAGSAYGETVGEIQTASMADLEKNYGDEIKAMRAEGMTNDQIRTELASEAGIVRAGIVAPTAGALSRLGAGFQLNQTGRAVNEAGSAVSQSVARGTARSSSKLIDEFADVAGEVVEEAAQGGASQLAGKVGEKLAGNENVDWAEGVGSEIGIGAMAAGGLSGGMRSPSAGISAAQDAAVVGRGAALAAMDAIDRVGSEVIKEQNTAQAKAEAKIEDDLVKEADAVRTSVPQPESPEVPAPVSVQPLSPEDEAMAPAVVEKIRANAPDFGKDRLEATARLLAFNQRGQTDESISEEDFHAGGSLLIKQIRLLQREMAETTNENHKKAIQQFLAQPGVDDVLEFIRSRDPAELDAELEKLSVANPSSNEPLSPEHIRAVEEAIQIATYAPENMSSKTAEKVLEVAHDIPPADRKRVELARDMARVREEADELRAKVRPKSAGQVAKEIRTEGFQDPKFYKKSLMSHIQGVMEAVNDGEIQVAAARAHVLMKFAQHFQDRARAFDLAAARFVATGEARQEVLVGGTITENGEYSKKQKFTLNMGNDNSMAVADSVFVDANEVAKTFNLLLDAHPDLANAIDEDLGREGLTFDLLAPQWKTLSGKSAAREYASKLEAYFNGDSDLAPAMQAQPEQPPAQTPARVQAAPAATEPAPKIEAKAEPEAAPVVSRITPEQAQRLDKEGMSKRVKNILAKGDDATDEDKATLAVLRAEIKRRQEVAAAQKQEQEDKTSEPAKSRVTAEQAEKLSDNGLKERIQNLLTKQVQREATPEDEATLLVLNRELARRQEEEEEAADDSDLDSNNWEGTSDGKPSTGGKIKLNEGQKKAFNEVLDFINDPVKKTWSLIGSAGTGKTTLINEILANTDMPVILSSPTHRANSVLRSKNPDREILTLHKMLGLSPEVKLEEFDAKTVKFKPGERNNFPSNSLIVIDESSMINDDLFAMLSQRQKGSGSKIIFMGDAAQLRPVKQNTDSKALTSTEGVSELTEVMRAKNAELLNESVHVRENGQFSYTTDINENNGVGFFNSPTQFLNKITDAFTSEAFKKNPLLVRVVAATNKAVVEYNEAVRQALYGANPAPFNKGEILMGYASMGKQDRNGMTAIANGVDYLVEDVGRERKVFVAGTPMQVSTLRLRDAFSGELRDVVAILPTNSEEAFNKLAENMQELLDKAIRRQISWQEFYAIKDTYAFPKDLRSAKTGKFLVAKTFDYGYAHTIHKSQGGTYSYVFVDDLSVNKFDARDAESLRYVGLTRAERGAFVFTTQEVRRGRKPTYDKARMEDEAPPTVEIPASVPEEVAEAPSQTFHEDAPERDNDTNTEAVDTSPVTEKQAASGRTLLGPASNGLGLISHMAGSINKFIRTFKMRKDAQGLFAKHGRGAGEKVVAAAKDGNLADFLAPGRKHLAIPMADVSDEMHAAALEHLLVTAPETLVESMNQVLNDTANGTDKGISGNKSRSGGWLQNALNRQQKESPALWDFIAYRQLHLVQQNEDGTFQYQPHVAQAVATAAVRWATDMLAGQPNFTYEDVNRAFFNGEGIPHDMEVLFRSMHHYKDPLKHLARDISETLGLVGDKDAPLDWTDGMFKAMAANALRALVDTGMVSMESRRLVREDGESGDAELYFIRFRGEGHEQAAALKKSMEFVSGDLLKALLLPESAQNVNIGKPSEDVPTVATGSRVKLAKKTRQALKNLNATVFNLNAPAAEYISKVGIDVIKAINGYDFRANETNTNKTVWEKVKGLNSSIDQAVKRHNELMSQLSAYTREAGGRMSDHPIFFNWRAISNTRAMVNGASPQSSKILRLLYSPNKTTIDLKDDEHVLGMYMMFGQALDIVKTEYTRPEQVMEIAKRMLETDPEPGSPDFAQHQAIRTARRIIDQQLHEGLNTRESKRELVDAIKASGMHPNEGLHALITHARYKRLPADATSFEHSMFFEIDGKTDGSVNALVHFGMSHMSPKLVKQLRQGGIILNAKDGANSLNTLGRGIGDLYSNTTERAAVLLRQRLEKTDNKSLFVASGRLLHYAGLVKITEGDQLTEASLTTGLDFVRNLVKPGTMTTVYGSGIPAVVWEMVGQLNDSIFTEINNALKEKRVIDQDLLEILEVMFGKGNRRADLSALRDPEQYLDFVLTPKMQANLFDNLMETYGSIIGQAVRDEMGSTMQVFELMYNATALQHFDHKARYQQLVEAHYRAKEAKGDKYARLQALSRSEEEAILAKIEKYAPIYKIQNDQEISLAARETGGSFMAPMGKSGKLVAQQVQSLGGGFPVDIALRQLERPGVKIASQYTIALGDATMMTSMWADGPRRALNVFDGYNASNDLMFKEGQEINQKLWENYQFDALGAVLERFNNLSLDPRTMPAQDLKALIRDLRISKDELESFGMEGAVANRIQLIKTELETARKRIALTKEAMGTLNMSVDHMGGVNRPHMVNANGVLLETDEEISDYINDYVAARMSPESVKASKQDAGEGVKSLTGSALRKYLADKNWASSLHRTVVNLISKSLPANLEVFIGTPDQIVQKQRELFPEKAFIKGNGHFISTEDGRNIMFLRTSSEEVMVHELIHAATLALVRHFYANGGKGMTDSQKAAVKDLEKLARHFLTLPHENQTHVAQVQDLMNSLLAENRIADMVNEYMAYGLSNRVMANALMKQGPLAGVRAIAKKFVEALRKMLGLPNNADMNNLLTQTFGRTEALIRNAELTTVTGEELAHSLNGSSDPLHQKHLESVNRALARMEMSLPADPDAIASLNLQEGLSRAESIRDVFAAPFDLSDLEQHLFTRMSAMLLSASKLDSNVLNQMNAIYREVMDELSADSFLDDPQGASQLERNAAERQYQLLLKDFKGTPEDRSALLANFVALSQVHPKLRAVLNTMHAKRVNTKEGDANDKVRAWTENLLRKASDVFTHSNSQSHQRAIDSLVQELSRQFVKASERVKAKPTMVDQAGAHSDNMVQRASDWFETKALKREEKNKIDTFIKGGLNILAAATSEVRQDNMSETILTMANQSKMPSFMLELINDLLGMTSSKEPLYMLLDRAKHVVSRIRQRLRDEVPGIIRGYFSRELSEREWAAMTQLGRSDMQVFAHLAPKKLASLLSNDLVLKAEIASRWKKVTGPFKQDWIADVEATAKAIMVDGNESRSLLYKNAYAMVRQAGKNLAVSQEIIEANERLLDELITLESIKHMSRSDRDSLASLMLSEGEGMAKTLNVLRALVENEQAKLGAEDQLFNQWKGDMPRSTDPRTHVMLAHISETKALMRRGYHKIEDYVGDPDDKFAGQYAYFASSVNVMGRTFATAGQPGYVQGVLQTVSATVSGADALTGRSLRDSVSTTVRSKRGIELILEAKLTEGGSGNQNLIPVFDHKGKVKFFERPLDRALLDKHMRVKNDLADSIGMWYGRQSEETAARVINTKLIGVLKDVWEKEKSHNAKSFVNIADPKDPVAKQVWEAIPEQVKTEMAEAFNGGPLERGQKPVIWVRKDMRNNALGYRSASVADVFTGNTQVPEEIRDAVMKTAYALMGKNAYQYLTVSEKMVQGLIGTAKDWIVVRSGTVALANGAANQLQLIAHDVPLKDLARLQAAKGLEALRYLKLEKRRAEITLELASTNDIPKKSALRRELTALNDEYDQMSIKPLVEAGQLPTITEGLAENDEYTLTADLVSWFEKKAKNMPKGLMTAAKFAVVSKDTALYQGMNRAIQLSDFVARAVLFDKYIAEGKTVDEALRITNERFVNYNLTAGRTRDYLESMGLLWFWNYKLRIQKVAVAAIRENPLKFFTSIATAGMLDIDSLYTSSAYETNWDYSIGPDMFYRASEMNVFRQATGL